VEAFPARSDTSFNENAEVGIGSEADLSTSDAEDARVAGPEHSDAGASAQTEFFETMHVVATAGNPADRCCFACYQ
jgi:hypothetical protein